MLSPERRAAYSRAELERLIAPRSIAVVGASPRAGSFGMRTLENLAQYAGEVFPVNAKYESIGALRCYASLAALPQAPDCVVLVVPREGAESALEQAAAAGAGSAIVFASGYGEMAHDEAGRAQRRLTDIARAARMPLLGPNCMGLVNHALRAGVTFLSEYARAPRAPGSIAIVSQSGALGYSLAQAWDRGLGIRYFFSCGNSADIDVGDLVAAMAEDPEVRAIACLFEGAASALRLEGQNPDTDLKWSAIEHHLPQANHPFLSYVSFDTMEAVYGERVVDSMTGHLSSVRRNRDLFVGVVGETTKSTASLADFAHVHLRVENLDGTVVLYGQKPFTGLYALSFDVGAGLPRAMLHPIA